jgi:hypothetical protein
MACIGLLLSSAERENEWSCTSVSHRDNFIRIARFCDEYSLLLLRTFHLLCQKHGWRYLVGI